MSQTGSQLFDDNMNIPNFIMKDISKKWARTWYHMSCVDDYFVTMLIGQHFKNLCTCTMNLTIENAMLDNMSSLIIHLHSFMLLNGICVDCTLQHS